MIYKHVLKITAIVATLGMASFTVSANVLDDVKERGKLVCGTLGTSEPFSFQDAKTREVVGYEVDLCKEIAEHIGVNLEIKMVAVAARIPELIAGRVDVVAANLGWSPERAEQIDYSYSNYVSPQKILIRSADAEKLTVPADLSGKRVSAVSGSSSEAGAKKLIPDVTAVTFKDPPTAYLALVQNKVSGMVGSELMLLKFKQDSDNSPVQTEIIEESLFSEPWGIGVRKGETEFLAEVNLALTNLENNGKAVEIFEKWFGEDTNFYSKREFKFEEIKR